MAQAFDPYRKWLGILPKDCPPTHYRMLGIELFESDPDVISHAADARMAHIRTFQSGRYSEQSQKILNEIAAAKVCLLNPEKKAQYDAELRQRVGAGAAVMPVAVAMPAAVAAVAVAEDPGPGGGMEAAAMPRIGRASSAAAVLARRRRSWQAPATLALLAGGGILLAVLVALATRDAGNADQANASGAQGTAVVGEPQPAGAKGKKEKSAAKPATEKPQDIPAAKPDTATPGVNEKPQPGPLEKQNPSGEKPVDPPVGPVTKIDEKPEPPGPSEKPVEEPGEISPKPKTEAPEAKPAPKLPVPDQTAQSAAEREVRGIFKDEFAAASSPEKKLSLAEKLIEQGNDTLDNPAARFVLFRLAADLAAGAGDATALGEAADRLAESYEVQAVDVKAAALESAAPAAADEESARRMVDALKAVAEEAAAEDAYDVADRLAKAAVVPARKTKDSAFVRDVMAWGREVERLSQRFAEVQKDLDKLGQSPDDPQANLAVGRWYALGVGRWEKALPYLAKGNDPGLAEAARRDLAAPGEANARLETGNRWWELAEKHQAEDRLALQGRAVHWYELAVPDLTGLSKTQAEKRIEAHAAATAGKEGPKKKGEYALAFDGEKSYATVPNFRYDGSQPITVEALVVPAANDKSCTVVGNITAAGGWGLGMFDLRQLGMENRHWAFIFRAQSRRGFPPATGSNAAAAVNQRIMLAAVCDGREIRFYIDGQKQWLTSPLRGPHVPGPQMLMIGAAPGLGGAPQDLFHGSIEQLRISLAARYDASYTPPKRLEKDKQTELLFNFDEGEGTVLRDASGNRHNGRIVGAKWVKRQP